MKYIADLKDATVTELEKWEAEWRNTVERQVKALDFLDGLPPIEELDTGWMDNMVQTAKDVAGDVEEWGKIAEALIEARRKPKAAA
jgi:hypothetical protein